MQTPLVHLKGSNGNSTEFVLESLKAIESKRSESSFHPHRHEYFAVLWIQEGKGNHFIDFENLPVRGNQIFFLRPGQVHDLRFENPEQVKGWVILFSDAYMLEIDPQGQIFRSSDIFYKPPIENCLAVDDALNKKLNLLITNLQQECIDSESILHRVFIASLLKIMLIQLIRSNSLLETSIPKTGFSRGKELSNLFLQLVEEHFRSHHHPGWYAEQLHVSAAHLSEMVKQYYGYTAGEYIRNRINTEAKRMLAIERIGLKNLAYALGFEDPTHFSKFFKQHNGMPFSTYLQQSQEKYNIYRV